MKVEYVTSPIGGGTELYISAAEYKRVNSKDGWSDRQNLMFAVRSYTQTNQSRNKIKSRDLEEAFRHIKKDGTIVLATNLAGEFAWCEIYVITDNKIIPVLTSSDGENVNINYSEKTKRELNRKP